MIPNISLIHENYKFPIKILYSEMALSVYFGLFEGVNVTIACGT
jgi:hypothetical protein